MMITKVMTLNGQIVLNRLNYNDTNDETYRDVVNCVIEGLTFSSHPDE